MDQTTPASPHDKPSYSLYAQWQGEPEALARARDLRREATDAENRLWRRLRGRQVDGARFRRQQPLGPYIVDFFCYEKGLVVEVDGGQHAEHPEYDTERTRRLETQGFRVLRFWNNQVLQETDGVVSVIRDALGGKPPS